MDTIREVKFILYKKVSFIQGFFKSILIHFGTSTNVLYTDGVLLEEFYCSMYVCTETVIIILMVGDTLYRFGVIKMVVQMLLVNIISRMVCQVWIHF